MQQRALGPDAADDGELGPALEAQAHAVERALRGEQVDPDELAWPDDAGPEPGYLTWSAESGFAAGLSSGLPSGRASGTVSERAADATSGRTSDHGHVLRPGPRGPLQRAPITAEPGPADAVTSEASAPDAIAAAVGAADTGLVPLVYADQPQWPEPPAEPDATIGTVVDPGSAREEIRHTVVLQRLDATDPVLLDELAAGLYPRVRSQLRGELIADRERAGNLTEFS
jgi:hypothetical protein